MPSNKTPVIEHIFRSHWNPATQSLSKARFTMQDVEAAIRHCNELDGLNRSTRNQANFMKDLIRKSTASSNWPQSVTRAGYTARQVTGDSNIFEFIPMAHGQTDPFPDLFKYNANKRPPIPVVPLQSLSMLNESKMLGRRDEAWLTQVAVRLGVVESHFAMHSPYKASVQDIVHLQMSMKLRLTEIDAFYMGRFKIENALQVVAITCEAKQHNERVLENQIEEQVRAVATVQASTTFHLVVPIAMRAVKGKGIYVAEFNSVGISTANSYTAPLLVAESMFEFHPPVMGI